MGALTRTVDLTHPHTHNRQIEPSPAQPCESVVIDSVQIEVAGGAGGDGGVSFLREKFSPLGGPDGGDGGRGADVILVADSRLASLDRYSDSRVHAAAAGVNGSGNQRRGASASPLELPVPVGTTVWLLDSPLDQPIADLERAGDRAVIARGGRGGMGNRRFATSTRQAPKWAQSGAAGQQLRLRLELKLIADVGIVGLPNAGKSTLLTAWSNASPKIGDYPFTTLEPQLGVVNLGYDSFVAADMPGLIEGASEGVGLGIEFLRHIERTRVLVHLLDMTREEPLDDFTLINDELKAFGHGLPEKPQILGLNKMDDSDAQARLELLQPQIEALGLPRLSLSAATREGTRELALRALQALREVQMTEQRAAARELPVLTPAPAQRARFEAYRGEDGMAVVDGPTPNWLAQTLPLDEREAREEFYTRLRRMGVQRVLNRLKVVDGERIRVGGVELAWEA
ncbi:MAG: GTPase ObgE [Chloroflexi bacterium]|nr:GTPase ObgE [Chloroflexota bacterium]MQC18200.1 GTPase ObgE [Chloroflexota bacterium]